MNLLSSSDRTFKDESCEIFLELRYGLGPSVQNGRRILDLLVSEAFICVKTSGYASTRAPYRDVSSGLASVAQ